MMNHVKVQAWLIENLCLPLALSFHERKVHKSYGSVALLSYFFTLIGHFTLNLFTSRFSSNGQENNLAYV